MTPSVAWLGEDGLLVDLDEPVSIRAARRARLLAATIGAHRTEGDPAFALTGTARAAATSVLVPVPLDRVANPADLEGLRAALLALVRELPADPPPAPDAREHRLAVRYGGEAGPDLTDVAETLGIHPDAVVALHCGQAYEVLFLGFAPGFGYLGELPEPLRLPRLATPRVRVPAGSVAIAGAMTAVYPSAGPGGWRLLGRTDAVLHDPDAPEPDLLRPGDLVRFTPR